MSNTVIIHRMSKCYFKHVLQMYKELPDSMALSHLQDRVAHHMCMNSAPSTLTIIKDPFYIDICDYGKHLVILCEKAINNRDNAELHDHWLSILDEFIQRFDCGDMESDMKKFLENIPGEAHGS